MIADKIIPSFYIVDIEGNAIESILPGDFGIKKISIGSNDFDTDLSATAALRDVLEFITSGSHLDLSNVTEKIDFNPEFFPTLEKLKLTEEQETYMAITEEMLDAAASKTNNHQQTIIMPRIFDDMGDFVESRWTINSPEFRIIGKIAVSPQTYIEEKAKQQFMQSSPSFLSEKSTIIH